MCRCALWPSEKLLLAQRGKDLSLSYLMPLLINSDTGQEQESARIWIGLPLAFAHEVLHALIKAPIPGIGMQAAHLH